MEKNFNEQDTLRLLNRTYGTKATSLYFVKRAKEAGDRLRLNITAKNELGIVQDATTMIAAIDQVYKLLADDNNKIADEEVS